MKILIFIDEITGEIFTYALEDESKDAVFIQPRIKKKEGEVEEDEEVTH